MKSNEIRGLDDLMGGALTERFVDGIKEVAANIADPNTDPKKARKITVTATFKPSEQRDVINMTTEVKTALAAPVPVATSVLMDSDNNGVVTLAEITKEIPGQMDFDGNETVQKIAKIK